MNASCHTYEWVMSAYEWDVSHMKERCPTYEWVVSHMWMNSVLQRNALFRAYERGMSQIVTHSYEDSYVLYIRTNLRERARDRAKDRSYERASYEEITHSSSLAHMSDLSLCLSLALSNWNALFPHMSDLSLCLIWGNNAFFPYMCGMIHPHMCGIIHMGNKAFLICVAYEWGMSHIWMRRVPHINESCHTHEWVMSYMWMCHVPHMKETCPKYE